MGAERLKNSLDDVYSSITIFCGVCGLHFSKKILLILHQKHDHPPHIPSTDPPLKNRHHVPPIFEMEALEFTSSSSSSETSEGPSDQESLTKNLGEEPKAEPCANFLDHVTTRLARGKRKVSYSCNFCGKDLHQMLEVKQHIPHHIGHQSYTCDRPTCPKSFSTCYDRQRHHERHLAKELKKKLIHKEMGSPSPLAKTRTTLTKMEGSVGDPRSYLIRYCLCNQISYGDMVACDRKGCPSGEWFHFECVGLKSKPRGTWYCPPCQSLNQNKRKKLTSQKRSSKINL